MVSTQLDFKHQQRASYEAGVSPLDRWSEIVAINSQWRPWGQQLGQRHSRLNVTLIASPQKQVIKPAITTATVQSSNANRCWNQLVAPPSVARGHAVRKWEVEAASSSALGGLLLGGFSSATAFRAHTSCQNVPLFVYESVDSVNTVQKW